MFPGAGGMPIRDGRDAVVAGIAASGATVGPFVDYPGADRRKLIADGKPANCEDLLVHYALGIPYEGQHGDDEQRWIDAYGSLPDEPGLGDGRPAAGLRAARARVGARDRRPGDRRGAGARRAHRGRRSSTTAATRSSRTAWTALPTAAPFVAEAVAAAAATFQLASEDVDPGADDGAARTASRPSPGGLPVAEGDRTVAGIGVAGDRSRYVPGDRADGRCA